MNLPVSYVLHMTDVVHVYIFTELLVYLFINKYNVLHQEYFRIRGGSRTCKTPSIPLVMILMLSIIWGSACPHVMNRFTYTCSYTIAIFVKNVKK